MSNTENTERKMENLVIENGGLTEHNTEGYSDFELSVANKELDNRLKNVEYNSEEYHIICSSFSDEFSRCRELGNLLLALIK